MIMNRKRTLFYIGIISLLITMSICVIFAKELFFKRYPIYAFEDYSFLSQESNDSYSELEIKELKKVVRSSGYKITSNTFISTNDDPQIIYEFDDKSINEVTIMLKDAIEQPLNIKVYTNTGDGFITNQFYSGIIESGDLSVIIDIPKKNYESIRVDIGDVPDITFNLDKIIISINEYSYDSYISVVKIQLIYFMIFSLLYWINLKKFNYVRR